MGPTDRVVILIDMDCFYCQVEEKLDPALKGEPIAVVQYNPWKGGGIIAVNYPARDRGVTRHMRGNDAKEKCPAIKLVRVPQIRGKADLTKYRDAGKRVADVLQTFTPLLERASVDEAYLDVTELVKKRISVGLADLRPENMKNTFVVGCDTSDFLDSVIGEREMHPDNLNLAVGGLIAEEIRAEVYKITGYKCSAGIAHNKILAKLVCGLHKPNKQTILPHEAVHEFFETIPVHKIRSLGGKFGKSISEDLGITYMGELARFSERDLAKKFDDKTASWLYNVARGVDLEPVTTKILSKSVGSCKNFTGGAALKKAETVQHWLAELAQEISERLEKDLEENNRRAKQIIVSFIQDTGQREVSSSRTQPLFSHDPSRIMRTAFDVIRKFCLRADGSYCIKFLGISAGNFEDVKNVREITSFFKPGEPSGAKIGPAANLGSTTLSDGQISGGGIADSESDAEDDVYSKQTQELEENEDDLIFYDDSRRIPLSPKPVENERESTPPTSPPLSSFFHRYFSSMKATNESSTKCTSMKSMNESPTQDITIIEDSLESSTGSVEGTFETCPDCNKRIPMEEFMSHQDYHFALKLVREESSRQRPEAPPKQEKQRKGRKRESKEVLSGNGLLMTFIQGQDSADPGPVEMCPVCGKKIKVEEVASHADYHAAKRLHQEINNPARPAEDAKAKADGKAKANGKAKKQRSCGSVVSFFKPL